MRTAIGVWLIVAILAVGVQGQARPNFAGTWTVVPSRSVWFDNGTPVNLTVFGERFTAEQTDQALTIAIQNEPGFKWIYRLDGVVSPNAIPGPNGPQETRSTTAWTESTLIITTVGSATVDGRVQQAETRRRLKFNEDGTLLVEANWGRDGGMIGSVYARQQVP